MNKPLLPLFALIQNLMFLGSPCINYHQNKYFGLEGEAIINLKT